MLTIDGRPAPAGIRIDFEPQAEQGSTSTGYTGTDGRYEMRFNVRKVGVMPGESLVRISIEYCNNPGTKPSVPEHLKGITLPPTVNVESTLRKTVKPGHNEIDIAVETKPAKK